MHIFAMLLFLCLTYSETLPVAVQCPGAEIYCVVIQPLFVKRIVLKKHCSFRLCIVLCQV